MRLLCLKKKDSTQNLIITEFHLCVSLRHLSNVGLRSEHFYSNQENFKETYHGTLSKNSYTPILPLWGRVWGTTFGKYPHTDLQSRLGVPSV